MVSSEEVRKLQAQPVKRGPSREQVRLMKSFFDFTSFEFMVGEDGVSADDPKGFVKLWNENIQWILDMAHEADYIAVKYRAKHG